MNNSNPYVGPRSFQNSEKLYGRDRELNILTDRLIAERIVLLHSPSGAGKTSLVQAGLIPALTQEGFFVHPVIRVNAERPTDLLSSSETFSDPRRFNRYVFSTLLSLEERYPPEKRTKLNRLARLSLGDYLTLRSLEEVRDGPELLIFDQFEEVLTTDPNDRFAKNSFFSQLRNVLRNRNRWALFVMRTDYVGALEPYARNIPTYFSNTFHLDLLGEKAARDAIQKPARNAGVEFADAAAQKLVDDLRRVQVQLLDGTVQNQLGLYIEPVQLQVVCYRLWEGKDPEKTSIDEDDLASVGNVNQSLSDYYAMTVARAAEVTRVPERSIREWFDYKLISPESTRLLVRVGVDFSDGLPNATIREIETTHLVRSEKRAGQLWYELAHDRLIEPIRTDNKRWFETNLNLFQQRTRLWVEQGRGEGLLLRGSELDVAEKQSKDVILTPDESTYLEACRLLRKREQRDLTQRRMIAVGFVISLALFFVAVFFSMSAVAATNDYREQVVTANAANTEAISKKLTADAASTQAVLQQEIALTALNQAILKQVAAAAASTQAFNSANAAATALVVAESEKANADQQKLRAQEQELLARANELAALSILAQNQSRDSLASLLAVEAFQIVDDSRTRIQLLSRVSSRGWLLQGIANQTGISPYLAFYPQDAQAFISSNLYGCALETSYYNCSQGQFTIWNQNTVTYANREVLEIDQERVINLRRQILDAVAISPDGKTIATAYCIPTPNNVVRCEEEKLFFWDAETYARIGEDVLIATNSYNTRNVLLAYSPDGSSLAVMFNNETIVLLDGQNYTEKGRFTASNGVSQMAFSPDGKRLAFVSGTDKSFTLLDVDSMQVLRVTQIPLNVRFLISLAYSPDGTQVALGSTDGSVLLWDLDKDVLAGQLYEREGQVVSLAYSPDGKVLAAGYDIYMLVLWDVSSRAALVRPIFRHTEAIRGLAFSADGNMMASAGDEIILWDMSPESWVNKACNLAGRNFSQDEWRQYFPGESYRRTCPQWPDGK